MNASRISMKDIRLAFRQLKSHVYHDNMSLALRIEIAEYESNGLKNKLKLLFDKINIPSVDEILAADIDEIRYQLFPKKFRSANNEDKSKGVYYTNRARESEYEIEKCIPFISCSVDIHIFTVLWISKMGVELDGKLSDDSFGNRLYRLSEGDSTQSHLRLFKPYYKLYNQWRDTAIEKAKSMHSAGNDVAILSLDFKDYYHNIDLELSSLDVNKSCLWMNKVLGRIHEEYRRKLKKSKIIDSENEKNFIPIGLLSSQILSNYYLNEFDKKIKEAFSPVFYGRYVDDILLVISNPSEKLDTIAKFLSHYSLNQQGRSREKFLKKLKTGYSVNIGKSTLEFQKEKIRLFYFRTSESVTLLDEFLNEIRRNSSEFRLQPDDKSIYEAFESSSYKITYSDTVNKIRSISAFDLNKLGASTHLSKLIRFSTMIDEFPKVELAALCQMLRSFFQGGRGLEMYRLWEKLFTFYVVNKISKEFVISAQNIIEAILSLKHVGESAVQRKKTEDMQNALFKVLAYSIAMASILDKSFFTEKVLAEVKDKHFIKKANKVFQKLLTLGYVATIGAAIKAANMLRHYYITVPLSNYCNQDNDLDYVSRKRIQISKAWLDKQKIDNSPRYIYYHEIALFSYNYLWSNKKNQNAGSFRKNRADYIYSTYCAINKIDANSQKECYPSEEPVERFPTLITTIVPQKVKRKQLKIGIVNHAVNTSDTVSSILDNPHITSNRRFIFNRILNTTLETQCDLLIFPEISVPLLWLGDLCEFSRRNQIVVICGLEHFKDDSRVYNYLATLVPFSVGMYRNCYLDLRLKKDYSPEEIKDIENLSLRVPRAEMRTENLRRFLWEGIFFSTLNCFELSDIAKRNAYKGMIDFLVTVEYNKDIPYFSNITESLARDIHSFIIQVNTSQYGDSRITQPAKTEIKDIVKIKGGADSLLITGIINIAELREFQSLSYLGQEKFEKEKGYFKKVPANFNKSTDRRRIV